MGQWSVVSGQWSVEKESRMDFSAPDHWPLTTFCQSGSLGRRRLRGGSLGGCLGFGSCFCLGVGPCLGSLFLLHLDLAPRLGLLPFATLNPDLAPRMLAGLALFLLGRRQQ